MRVRGLLEPKSAASGRFSILRKDQHEVFGKLRSATTILDVAEHRSRSSGKSSHNFDIVMGLGRQFCISGVIYGNTINIEDIVNIRIILDIFRATFVGLEVSLQLCA